MTNKFIPLKTINHHIGIRIPRIIQKAQKLNLSIVESEEEQSLKKEDAIKLLHSYSNSAKVSEGTKQGAIKLIQLIEGDNNEITLPLDKRTPSKINRKQPRTKSRPKPKPKNWTNTLFDVVHAFVHQLISSGTQAIEFCVRGLTSVHFRFIALFVAVAVQMHHSAEWFYRIQPDHSMITAYGYAFMVDLFILVVTLEGKRAIARTFAWFTFLSNVLYFQFWVGFDYSAQAYTNAISSILVSSVIAYIIFAYTELFVQSHDPETIFKQ